jgi:SAM-dependent methyltransferase
VTDTTPLRALDLATAAGCRLLSSPDGEQTDADADAQRILDVVRTASDLSASSQELTDAASDPVMTDALVPARAHLARALELPAGATVLEIGCGFGPVTRYLGEQCATVDALEPDPARAAVARLRTQDLSSVEVFVGGLDDVPAVPAYDVVVVIGAFEYAAHGSPDLAPYVDFLRRCHAVLKDGGTLVVALQNPLGVKYLSGAADDHTRRPFDSLEGYQLDSPARTFPRATLERLLREAGFTTEVLAAFPDHTLPRVVMSDALFSSSGQLAENLPRFPSPDRVVSRLKLADEQRTWGTLVQAGIAEHFANSFLVLAGKGSGPSLWPDTRQAVLFNSERQPEFTVRAEVRGRAGELHIARFPLYPDGPRSDHPDIRHAPAATEPVVPGRELLLVLLDEPEHRPELLRRWAALVPDREWAPVDLVPHNVVLTEDDELVAIDQEWSIRGFDRDLLLLRGLLLSAVQMVSRARPDRLPPGGTIAEFVAEMGAEIGLQVDGALFDRLVEHESAFQAAVNTTHRTPDLRRAQSAEALRQLYAMSVVEARRGERFDVQWERAQGDIDRLYQSLAEQQQELERRVAEYEQVLEQTRAQAAEEAAALRARIPSVIVRRVLDGVLARVLRRDDG